MNIQPPTIVTSLVIVTGERTKLFFAPSIGRFFLQFQSKGTIQVPFWANDLSILHKVAMLYDKYPQLTIKPEIVYLYYTGDLSAHQKYKSQYEAVASMLEDGKMYPFPPQLADLTEMIVREVGKTALDPFMWTRAGLEARYDWPERTGQVTKASMQDFYRAIHSYDSLIDSLCEGIDRFALEHQLFEVMKLNNFTLRERICISYALVKAKECLRLYQGADHDIEVIVVSEINQALKLGLKVMNTPLISSFLKHRKIRKLVFQYFKTGI